MGVPYQILFVLLAVFFVFFICRSLFRHPHFLKDIPNQRSDPNHSNYNKYSTFISRGGGFALALVFIPFSFFCMKYIGTNGSMSQWQALLAGVLFFAILGFIDDMWQLSASLRLLLSVIACSLLLAWFYKFNLNSNIVLLGKSITGWWLYFLQLLWLLCCLNFFNFMDGSDTLAGMQGLWISMIVVIACLLDLQAAGFEGKAIVEDSQGLFSYLFWRDRTLICNIYFLLFACLASFLYWNWPPARVFMGDTGSYMLGFLCGFALILTSQDVVKPASTLPVTPPLSGEAIHNNNSKAFDSIIVFLAWLPFLMDTIFTLFLRLYRRQNLFRAHRDHLYQYLREAGWPPLKVTFFYACLNLSLLVPILSWFIWRHAGITGVLVIVLFITHLTVYWYFRWENTYIFK